MYGDADFINVSDINLCMFFNKSRKSQWLFLAFCYFSEIALYRKISHIFEYYVPREVPRTVMQSICCATFSLVDDIVARRGICLK